MKKRKKRKADLTQANRWGGRRAAVEMHAVEAQAEISLSLSLSDVKRSNVLEVKKKIKRRGFCVLCGREKQEKEKRKKEMKCG